MSGTLGFDPEFSDVTRDGYKSAAVAVGNVTAVEAKADTTSLDGREWVSITNMGPNPIYYGPASVTSATGDVLYKNQFVCLPHGKENPVYMICAATHSANVRVQEGA